MMLVWTVGVQAYPTQWIGESHDYTVGETVGGWNILEYKDASYGGGQWSAIGTVYGGDNNSSSVMWICYSNTGGSVSFGVKSTAVAFMLENDTNDGYADIYVDSEKVFSNYFMQNLPQYHDGPYWTGTLVVSGLTDDYHTIEVLSTPGYSGRNDVHVYGGAAVSAVTATPVPAAVWLLGSGFLGILGFRRKISK